MCLEKTKLCCRIINELFAICQIEHSTSEQDKRKKKVPTRIISFDDDNEESERKETTTSSSAPPTCPGSPTTTSTKDSTSPCLSDPQPQTDLNGSTMIDAKLPEWERWFVVVIN